MALIKASRLDRTVTLLRRGAPVDNGRTVVPGAWEILGDRSASVKPRIGREALEHGTRAGEAVQSCWLRHDELTRTLTRRDAVELDGQRYEITAPPIEIGRREGIELLIVAAEPEEA